MADRPNGISRLYSSRHITVTVIETVLQLTTCANNVWRIVYLLSFLMRSYFRFWARWIHVCVINIGFIYMVKASRLNAMKASKSKALAAIASGLGECCPTVHITKPLANFTTLYLRSTHTNQYLGHCLHASNAKQMQMHFHNTATKIIFYALSILAVRFVFIVTNH